jgi:putative Mn2+ efflux pump MntP
MEALAWYLVVGMVVAAAVGEFHGQRADPTVGVVSFTLGFVLLAAMWPIIVVAGFVVGVRKALDERR